MDRYQTDALLLTARFGQHKCFVHDFNLQKIQDNINPTKKLMIYRSVPASVMFAIMLSTLLCLHMNIPSSDG